jgi:transcriptional regulator with GAF, ATPase, and Fis domain
LKNVIERAVILTQSNKLQLPEELKMWMHSEPAPEERQEPETPAAPVELDEVQRRHIMRVLKQTFWRIEGAKGAAAILGINPGTLRSRMKRLGICRPVVNE